MSFRKDSLFIILPIIFVLLIGGTLFWLKSGDPQSQATAHSTSDQSENTLSSTDTTSAHAPNLQNAKYSSQSQQDIDIDCKMNLDAGQRLIVNEQTKNCFEYFITQYGEKSIDQIKTDFEKYIRANYQEPALSQILDLWTRYMDYREQLGKLQPPTSNSNTAKYYREIYEKQQNLRKTYFSREEIQGLFGEENLYHEYTLQRLEILEDKSLSEAEKGKRLKELFEQLPADWKENLEQMNKLEDLRTLTADLKARNASAQEIRQMRLNLVGAEATGRLETLDTQRSQWQQQVNSYLAQRDSILQSGMSESAKTAAINDLKQQQFNSAQDRMRLNTFETVHDQGGKLPFS
ncbi:Lipase chaperone LimK [Acinetobacter marinus]|uniref:Lipase chaperone n=1 Tax=Acinetobacter marinus TaxID=281375 RepID=A0A1G6KIV2_9GAMM|nr:lipase secretion chaperone [Acinetobacter marinus]SDC30741.1 Lipase chaperone LimK [Acinetobacter marinus]